jgi:hypothetical protein
MGVSGQIHALASVTPETGGVLRTGGSVSPRANIDAVENRIVSRPHWKSNPDSSAF